MRQKGTVVALENEMARVRFTRSDMCGSCHACFRGDTNEAEIELQNSAHASVGDVVFIELHESLVLKASLLMYGIPLVGLLLGVVCCASLGDLYAAAGGILLCASAFLLLRVLEPRFKKKGKFKPRMVAVEKNHNKQESV